jgi:hypothetical protein
MGSGTAVVNESGWVRIEDNGLDGSNRPAPKSVILVDDEARSLVEGYTAESDMTGFDSVEEAFAHLLEQVEGQESRLDSVEAALDEERAEREDIVEEFKEAIETVRSEIPARQ